MQSKIETLIKKFELTQHHEGGFYVETYRAKAHVTVSKENYGETQRTALTSIYFLLPSDDFSAWHKVKSNEIWSYHSGSSLTLLLLDKHGYLQTQILGDFLQDEKSVYQVNIPADTWFCAFVNDKNSYSLIGCAVGPGFEFQDFTLGKREDLIKQFPQHEALILRYTHEQEIIETNRSRA